MWTGEKIRVFVTVTFSELFHDGRPQMQKLYKRWKRRFGACHAIWWREFQRPEFGARCHYHLVVEMRPAEFVLLRGWLKKAWKECGGGFVDVKEWTEASEASFSVRAEGGLQGRQGLPAHVAVGGGRWCWPLVGCVGLP